MSERVCEMRICVISVCVCLASPLMANTQAGAVDVDTASSEDEESTRLPSDGLAECAAILAVASSRSGNLIQRNNIQNAAAMWFAKSGDVAQEEGFLPDADVWGQKVADWAGRIGSMDALSQNDEWMTYCAEIGEQHGLGSGLFADYSSRFSDN